MCESLGIVIKTAAAEAPWSNGLVERPGIILGQNCVQFLDAALDDFFFQEYVLSKVVEICYKDRGSSNHRCPIVVF